MKKFLKYTAIASLIAVVVSLGSGYGIYLHHSRSSDRPSVADALREMRTLSRVRFADGSTACEVGVERRVNTSVDKISDIAKKAFLAVEDEDFYSHDGINRKAILRAGVVFIKQMGKGHLQGGSTITQQVVKNLLLSSDKSLKRKIMEASLAIELENYLTEKLGSKKAAKDKILEIYLNMVNFGGGRYGIESASQDFFGKSALHLNLAESVALASLPKSPTKYNLRSVKGAKANAERSKHVLRRMVKADWITEEDREAASSARLVLVPKKNHIASFSQEICDAGKARLRAKVCPGLSKDSDRDRLACELKMSALGTTVDTTIDAKVQAFAHRSLEQGRAAVGKRHPKNGAPYAAVVVIRNKTGEVMSMASTPYVAGGLNYAYALRQPGSTFKPFVFGACFEYDQNCSPETVFVDEESYLDKRHPEKVWPSNYEPEFMGAVNIRTALAHSVNTIAVKVIIRVDAANVIMFTRKLGITSELANERSLALGVSDVSPFEMANAYATFAREGEYVEPILFSNVAGDRAKRVGRRVMSKTTALQVLDITGAVITDGTGRKVKGKLPVVSYGKTGTTSGHTDAWFVLATLDYTVVVWVGHKTKMSLGGKETGASAALPMALDIMHFLYTGQAAGAVYSMSTKAIDDSQVVEGEDIIEEADDLSGGSGNNEEPDDHEDDDGESAPPASATPRLLQESVQLIIDNEPEEDDGQLHQGSAPLYQGPSQLLQEPAQLEEAPTQFYQGPN